MYSVRAITTDSGDYTAVKLWEMDMGNTLRRRSNTFTKNTVVDYSSGSAKRRTIASLSARNTYLRTVVLRIPGYNAGGSDGNTGSLPQPVSEHSSQPCRSSTDRSPRGMHPMHVRATRHPPRGELRSVNR